MRGLHVPARPALRQPPVALIAALSCGLSFWLTVRFCRQLCPGEGAFELLVMGLLWEGAKLVFGSYGLHILRGGSRIGRLRGRLLLVVSLLLAGGSIAASLGFLVQTDTHGQQQVLASSQAYLRTQGDLASIDRQLEALSAATEQDLAQNFRTRVLRSVESITSLRQERSRVSASLQEMELHPTEGSSTAFFRNLAGILPGDATRGGERLVLIAQCVLAVMLELIGLIALSLLRTPFLTVKPSLSATDSHSPRHPRTAVAHVADASLHRSRRRIENDASAADGRRGRGDTGVDDAMKNKRYLRAKALIQRAQLSPSYRAMQHTLEISQSTAQRYLQAMLAEGFLRREGRRYALAS